MKRKLVVVFLVCMYVFTLALALGAENAKEIIDNEVRERREDVDLAALEFEIQKREAEKRFERDINMVKKKSQKAKK